MVTDQRVILETSVKRERFTSGLTSRLLVTGLVCWAVAAAAYAVLRVTYGDRPVQVNVRWAATVDDTARFQLEQRYTLARPDPKGDRTFSYALTDRSLENISDLVRDPAVEDTHQIDRNEFQVESSAPSLPYVGIPAGLKYLSVLGFLGGLATIGVALITRSPTLVRWCSWVFGFVCGLASIGRTQLKRIRRWCNSVLGALDALASVGVALINRSPMLVRWIGFLDRVLARNQGLIRSSLIGLILLLPALSLTGLASVYLGQSLANFHPDMSDAIMYWHQIKTFAAVGFSGGYYTVGEEAAAASFTHFYAWGPWYIALYGLIGKVVGWNLWSPMLFDVAAVTLALLGGLLLIRPNSRQLVWVLLVLLTYWPLHLHLPRAMQEPFHYAVAIMLAGIFYRLLVHEGAVPHRLLAATLVMILGAGLVRPTWAVLLLPLVTIIVEKRPHGRTPRGSRFRQVIRDWPLLLPACVAIAGIFLLHLYVAAPFPNRWTFDVQLLLRSPVAVLQSLFAVTTVQGMTYLWPDFENPLWTLLRYQALGIVLWMTVLAFRRPGHEAEQVASGQQPCRRAERLTHVLNLALVVLLVVMLFDVAWWRDYRVVAPHLLLSLLLLVACGRTRVVAVAVLAGLLLTPSFLADYKVLATRQFTDEQARIDAFSAQTGRTLVYQAQDDPWCNTILLPFQTAFLPESLAIPAGIGISFDFDITSRSELKSRYVMVDDESRENLTEAFDLQFASTTAIGDLYTNAGTPCTAGLGVGVPHEDSRQSGR